jgi:hypothetical protein
MLRWRILGRMRSKRGGLATRRRIGRVQCRERMGRGGGIKRFSREVVDVELGGSGEYSYYHVIIIRF